MPYQDDITFNNHISKGIDSLNEKNQTPLMWAVSDIKRIPYVKKLINLGANVNFLTQDNNALNTAVKNNNVVAVGELIEAKANIDYVGSLSWYTENALNLAIKNNYTECARLLIEKKADVNVKKFACPTSLDRAISTKNVKIIYLLLKNKAEVKDPIALIDALSDSYFTLKDQIHLLKEAKALELENSSNETVLSYFVKNGDLNTVKLLLEEKADINKVFGAFYNRSSVLHVAIQNDRTACAKFLIENKANLELKNYKDTALGIAIKRKNKEITKLLIESKAVINNPVGIVQLLSNKKENLADFISLFKNRNVLNIENQENETLLSHFSSKGDLSAIKLLVEAKAEINMELGSYYNKDNALAIAMRQGYIECAKFLIEMKANIELKSRGQYTALHYAIKSRNKELIDILLQQGAVVTDAIDLLKTLSDGEMKLEKNISILKKSNAINVVHDNKCLLKFFIEKNDLKSIKLLIDSKAELNVSILNPHTYRQERILSIAIKKQDIVLTTLFIENGAKIEGLDLDDAVEAKNYKIMNLLLANNAYPTKPRDFAKFLINDTSLSKDRFIAVTLFLERHKNVKSYQQLPAETVEELNKILKLLKQQKFDEDMKASTFNEIDQLHNYHHLPKVLTNIIMEYDEYEPRLFQPVPADILVKARLNAEMNEENEKKPQSQCLVM